MALPHMAVDILAQWWQMFIVLWCTEESFYIPLMSRAPRARWGSGASRNGHLKNKRERFSDTSYSYHVTTVLFCFSAEAALWMQPHGLHHRAGRRHGHYWSHERFRHQAHEYPPESTRGPGIPWWCAGIHCHLQKAQQMRYLCDFALCTHERM